MGVDLDKQQLELKQRHDEHDKRVERYAEGPLCEEAALQGNHR